MITSQYACVDRDGVRLEPGQTIEVQHCVGRYGEVRRVSGKLVRINEYHGITMILAAETKPFTEYSRFGSNTYAGLDEYYVCNALQYDFKKKCMVGYHEHKDYEHGHEAWVKVQR
jgi:hypothetical protein